MPAKKMSSWRQMTPFGRPVVPPVYAQYRSSEDRGPKSRSGDEPGEPILVVSFHDDDLAQLRQVASDGIDAVDEAIVADVHSDVRVVEQMTELVGHVPEVHVDRDGADLEARQHALRVLRPVDEVQADVITRTDAQPGQMVCESVRALVQRAVRESAVTGNERLALVDGVGHELEQIGQVEGRHDPQHALRSRDRTSGNLGRPTSI